MEEWYSMAPLSGKISNPSITIGENVSRIRIAVQEFAITGYDSNSPFDLNNGAPANMTGTSNTMFATISTSDAQDMLLGFAYGGSGTFSPGEGFSGICLNVSPCAFQGIDADASEYQIVTRTQSRSAVSMMQAGGTSWGFISDAVRSASPSITYISPSKGIVGTGITITGTSFTSTLAVSFCTTLQPTFIVINDTLITTTAPQIALPPVSQTCSIVVTKNGGNSTALPTGQFSYLPNVESVEPMSGGNGTAATITGTSFVGTTSITLCGISQPRFTITNDTQIKLSISYLGATASQPCDVVITNSVGKSETSNRDAFTYTPQSGSGGTNHSPNTPTNPNKLLYITIASIAAIALVAMAGLMRRWDPRKKDRRQV
jgi:hypothetical protein